MDATAGHPAPRVVRDDEVVFYTYPKLLFAWLLILMGYALWPVDKWGWASPETLAWVWGITLLVTMLTLGVDIGRNHAAFWIVLIAAVWILIYWLRDVKGVTFFSKIWRFFADLDPSYSRNLGLIVSIVLSVAFTVMLAWARVNSKWRFTHNELEHRSMGRVDDTLGRGAEQGRASYPDLFESLLCMAGTLQIFDATGTRVLRTIPHVPLLPLIQRRIDRLLEMTAVTLAHMDEETGAASDAGAEGDSEHTV